MNGLILAGGNSSRMGHNKSLIPYQQKAQYLVCADLLAPYCNAVFVSCKLAQQHAFAIPAIPDNEEFGDIGPLNGLLSAFQKENSPWIVLGCDYPLITDQDILLLMNARDSGKMASAFFNHQSNIIEPLIAIYEPSTADLLRQWYLQGNQSLRKFLEAQNVHKIVPQNVDHLFSADTPTDYKNMKHLLSQTNGA